MARGSKLWSVNAIFTAAPTELYISAAYESDDSDMDWMFEDPFVWTGVSFAVTTHWHELNMAPEPNSRQCFGLGHNQTHAMAQLQSSVCLHEMQLMSSVVFRCVCLIVCITLGPEAVISHGEQNRRNWWWRTLLTTWLIKFCSVLQLMKSMVAHGDG